MPPKLSRQSLRNPSLGLTHASPPKNNVGESYIEALYGEYLASGASLHMIFPMQIEVNQFMGVIIDLTIRFKF